ncbi:MAG: tRNA lysidine(34) synthetase TilS [Armatimonadetes bacterium]|nr:tRNA lysidine(34) synthetase TilS [Armatimonadota bacterium]
MLSEFRASLQSTGLIPAGARVLLGYSGGADSTCLLHLLHGCGIDVVAAHLNHLQRPEAGAEAERCAAFADSLGVEFVGGTADVPAIARDFKIGLEEAGRKARYSWFASAKAAASCDVVATAHTMDDQIETVLFHLARGTGLDGLSGIPAKSEGLVRPLLDFRREETRRYCTELDLWFHDDPANDDLANARSRIRAEVVPGLEAAHPGAARSIVRLAAIAAEETAFLNGIAAGVLESAEVRLNGRLWFLTKDCEAAFDLPKVLAAPRVASVRALRLLAGFFGPGLDHDATLRLMSSLESTTGSWTLEGGEAAIEWSEGVLHARNLAPDGPHRELLTVPGRLESDYFGWALESVVAPTEGFVRPRGALEAVVDADALVAGVHLRAATPGDSIVPLGMSGSKKLSDLFQESRLTQAARSRLPIVCDMAGPVWVPGLALAERVKITENSRQGLLFRLAPFPS